MRQPPIPEFARTYFIKKLCPPELGEKLKDLPLLGSEDTLENLQREVAQAAIRGLILATEIRLQELEGETPSVPSADILGIVNNLKDILLFLHMVENEQT